MENKELSQSLEDYLEAIYLLAQDKNFTHANKIAEYLNVGKSSVSWALRQLSEKGLINYTPYEAITLTDEGGGYAASLAKRHQEIKKFLTEVLSVEDGLAEENACKMEHVLDKQILSRMKDFMAFLEHCPRAGAEWLTSFDRFCRQGPDPQRCPDCIADALQQTDCQPCQQSLPGEALPLVHPVSYTIRHLKEIMRDCEQELSSAQEAVVEAFFHAEHHIAAEELVRQARQVNERVTSETVDRTMQLLCQYKIARRVRFNNTTVFELFQPHNHHDHLYCVRCGSIIEFFDPRIEALQVDNARRASFRLLMHNLNIYGLCEQCMQAQERVRPLTDCHVGEHLRVHQLTGDNETNQRLADMGLTVGACVEILNQNGAGGHLVILLDRSRLMLDAETAGHILADTEECCGALEDGHAHDKRLRRRLHRGRHAAFKNKKR